jgi:hypothetical protein
MIDVLSYDVLFLGLAQGGAGGVSRYANAMARLTGRTEDDFQKTPTSFAEPIFTALDQSTAKIVAETLAEAGALIEIRPSTERVGDLREQVATTEGCPSCGFVQPAGANECGKCGLVFAKFEREQVQKMQTDRALEEALASALKSREEWTQRANQYLETHPLPPEAVEGFEGSLVQGEIPFLRLSSDEGPLLMTSRRMLAVHKDGMVSIPYEMVEDVTFGGGLVVKKSKVRLLLVFHAPLLVAGSTAKSLSWQLDKDSSFYSDVVMDWCFARTFMCGTCGARDLDYRSDDDIPFMRCMHCASDHEIDLREAIAIPRSVPE